MIQRCNVFRWWAFAVLLCSTAACQRFWGSDPAEKTRKAALNDEPAKVYVTQVKEQQLYEPLTMGGVIKAKIRRPLIAPLAGTLAVLHAKEGQRVAKGEHLLSIEPESLGLRYNDHKVFAPMAGILTNFRITLGSRINANQVLGELIDPSRELYTEVAATYEDLETLRQGLTVDVKLSPHSQWENSVLGTVTHISPTADETTRTFLVTVAIPCNSPSCRERIRVGTLAKVVAKQGLRMGFKVPGSYLHEEQSKVLSLTPDNKATWLAVKTGKNYGSEVEVVSGLSPETRIVTSFSRRPLEGEKVEVSAEDDPLGQASAKNSASVPAESKP